MTRFERNARYSLKEKLNYFKGNNMNYTTIEQSKRLLELGLNPDTADMAIVKDNTYCNALSAFNGVTLCQNYNEIKDKTNYIP